MPLKLVEPRPGRSAHYSVRGTYLGQYVDRSLKTGDKRIARKLITKIEQEIERGAYAKPGEHTFASAAIAYIQGGGERRFLPVILRHFGERPVKHIIQRDLDDAAATIYPNATPATRNRQLYSPAIAVLRTGGVEHEFKRPKGARGTSRTAFLSEPQAKRIFVAAASIDEEFQSFLIFLCYTGCRLSEACSLEISNVHLSDRWAYIQKTKNGDPRVVHLPPIVISALSRHADSDRPRMFRFRKNGRLYALLNLVLNASGVNIPDRVAFHIFRHTYGAWMKQKGADLVATGAWKSRQAASVYEHINVTEEARKADLLPVPKGLFK